MFTGIVEELGEVQSLGTGTMSIHARLVLDGLRIGDSIAVNGICLTVVAFNPDGFAVDVMPETMRRTSFAALKKGSRVNLERALTLQSRLGGHIVSGHIDGVGRMVSLKEEKNAVILQVSAAPTLLRYIIEKGSVTLDGISLTVVGVEEHAFSVSLIPHTYATTALGYKKPGDKINIENDIIGKYVERFLLQPVDRAAENKPEITRAFLMKYGF